MTYHHRARVRAPQPMGWISPAQFIEQNKAILDKNAQCRTAMENAGKVFETRRSRVTGALKQRSFYNREDFEAILFATQDLLTKASRQMDVLRADDFGFKTLAREEAFQIASRMGESMVFVTALNQAKVNNIGVIDSPGLWRWVEKALMEIELAYGVVAYMACIKPAWLTALEWAYRAAAWLVELAEKAVAAVIAVGQAILSIPDTVGAIWRVLKWGALIGGAAFLYLKVQQVRKA